MITKEFEELIKNCIIEEGSFDDILIEEEVTEIVIE